MKLLKILLFLSLAGATVTDYDGNVYETVLIGDQLWMAENLKVAHYRNGDEIPNITNDGGWGNLSTGAYSDYDNNPSNSETYGKLYNWHTVDDDRGLCPEGWHVTSDNEFTVLTEYLEGTTVAGGKIKDTGLEHWNSPNTGVTNESGFTGLPGGHRSNDAGYHYNSLGDRGYFWTSNYSNWNSAWYRVLYYNNTEN